MSNLTKLTDNPIPNYNWLEAKTPGPEFDAWNEYMRLLQKVPGWQTYDRVSIHLTFPEVHRAFDAYRMIAKMRRLGEKYGTPE